jgi:cardiolipin synthase
MRFRRALIGLPPSATPADAVTLAEGLVGPGGEVALWPDPERADGSAPRDGAVDGLVEVRGALAAAGVVVSDVLDGPPEVVVLPVDAAPSLVNAAIDADQVVALVGYPATPVRSVALVTWGALRRARPLVERLVGTPGDVRVHLVAAGEAPPADGPAIASLLGLDAAPEVHVLGGGLSDVLPRLTAFLKETRVDLVAVMAPPRLVLGALIDAVRGYTAGLVLVPGDDPWLALQGQTEMFAAVDLGDVVRCALVDVDPAGFCGEVDDRVWEAVTGGRAIGPVQVRSGQIALPSVPGVAFGLAADAAAPLATLEATALVLRAAGPGVALVPVDVDRASVAALRGAGLRVWAVAVALSSPSWVRAATDVDAVVHAGAILDDGRPEDLPAIAASIRLDRVARRLRAAGFPVVFSMNRVGGPGYAHSEPGAPLGAALEALRATSPPQRATDLPTALEARCGAVASACASLWWEDDNHAAREGLLRAIADAQVQIHLQSYIFDEDAVGESVVQALQGAAARGVAVRVLVDSLWAGHGSLMMENRLLSRLVSTPNLALQVFRPVSGVVDLKHRNHRKLMVVDGSLAIVPGRNVSYHYYTGFDEAAVGPTTSQDHVPWLDLSARVTGAVVATLDRLFAATWVEAGGAAIPALKPDQPRDAAVFPAWVVAHRGLDDANTLDAQREMIARARSRITLVNTFPLQHELQHALVARLREGVAVRFVTGHVRPWMRGGELPFPGAPGRDLMTELIHGRLDPLVRAGAEVWAAGIEARPGWDPAVGRVLPHVHTKWLSIDGEFGAFGSANLDISSAYWDSEVMVVVRSPARVGWVEARIDALIESSVRFDPEDPGWRRRADQRGWISQNWPSFLG